MASFSVTSIQRHGGQAQAVLAADRVEIGIRQRLPGDLLGRVAQHRLADAARIAENDAGAGLEPQRHVEGLGLELAETQPDFLDHARQFLRGEHMIDIGDAVAARTPGAWPQTSWPCRA